MRYSKNFQRDFKFYRSNLKFSRFYGKVLPKIEYSKVGLRAKECFYIYDSTGKFEPCREPVKLRLLLETKAGVNFHIKMWAEGYNDVGEGMDYYLEEFKSPPEWVAKAIRNLR